MTWLISPAGWRSDTLAQSIEALSLQIGAEECVVVFIGPVGSEILSLAEGLFPTRVRRYRDLETTIASIETPLVGYLGAGVILHDLRCSQFLGSMIDDPSVATASCVLVHSEARGQSFHTDVADPGRSASQSVIPPLATRRSWRSKYPVLSPPNDLWVASGASLAAWFRSDPQSTSGAHICTSVVTASHESWNEVSKPLIVPPAADAASAIHVETLFG